MKKILITGINGFIGRNLVNYILQTQKNVQIFGCDMIKSRTRCSPAGGDYQRLEIFRADINNQKQVADLIKKVRPDIVFHLAAVSSKDECERDKKKCKRINIGGTKNILLSIKSFCPKAKIIIASSSYVYKSLAGKIKEGAELVASSGRSQVNLYGWTKLQNELAGKQSGLEVVSARLFNIIGPGKLNFWTRVIGEAVSASQGGVKEVKINARFDDTVRDYTDIRDVARAFWLLAIHGRSGKIYNVCSGRGYKNRDIKREIENITKIKLRFKGFYKTPKFIGDSSRLKKLGWELKINIIKQTIPELLIIDKK